MQGQQFSQCKFIVIVSVVVSVFIGHSSVSAKQVSQKHADLYKEMLAASLKADQQLVTDMETVAETLKEFADAQGHFPDAGDDIAGLSLELSSVLPKNPYSGADMKTEMPEPASDLLDEYARQKREERAQVIFDPSLSETLVDKLSMEPYSTWKAKPGTVVAVTNGYDLCLVWGAGIDEQPVRDSNGKVRLTVLKSSAH